ncbi:MAG: type I-E CRISPR-associated protein Cas5/CasD [Desulfamplus sp.]|nr:type I-E CRISPR-associated protein Cas5/CasD [Desulfamplus sp.]
MENNKYILLWLEAPLQSWGSDSKFGRRDTLPFPTRSGVLGIVLCALGASGEQKELLARMGLPLRQTVISCISAKETKQGVTKRERDPFLTDFQMVGSGYDDKDPWEKLHIPKTNDGKPAVGGGTKLTYRYYLQNAVFAVIMETPSDLAESFAFALQNPVYDLYLGRKNCVPTEFIYQGTFDSEKDAESRVLSFMEDKNLIEDFRVLDGEQSEGDMMMTLNDVPVQFGTVKKYRDRRVTVVRS